MSDLGYLLRALLGKPDVELNNAQVRAEGDAMRAQSRYNQWRRNTGRIPVDYNRVRSIMSGERTSPLLNHPVNYNDPADVWRAHKNMMDYARIVGAEANPNEKAYRNKELAPRDKAIMGAPLVPKMPEPRNLSKPEQIKAASVEQQTITYKQAYQAKQASLQKKATLIGRGINSIFGADTWMGRTFGESTNTAAENFFRSQEAPGEREARRRAAAEYDARQAAINAHIDRGLVAANKRLAAGAGVTQRRQVAQLTPKPAAQPVPRVPSNTEKQMQQYRVKEDQAAATQRGNQLMAQQFARQGMSPYVPQQQIAESQRQTVQDKAMAQKQRELYGKPKRAPGIYNAQGQRWNGKAFV